MRLILMLLIASALFDGAHAGCLNDPASAAFDAPGALQMKRDNHSAEPAIDPCDTLDISDAGDDGAWITAGSLFLPPVVHDQIVLKRFIRDPRFPALKALCGDTAAANAIFLKALDIADGDLRHALLVAMFGTMDHFSLGLRIPIFGVLRIPLTTESDSTFNVRHNNLPRHVLPDSLGRRTSDNDKLQHFFGSAFIAYATNSRGLANLVGNLVEVGEDAFVVGGANDERDKLANRLGQEFGLRLLGGESLLPSDVLRGPSR